MSRPTTNSQRLLAWAGGGAFVLSIVYCFVFYAVELGQRRPPSPEPIRAAVVNTALFTIFALHHSLMARAGMKAWLVRIVPPELERSIYVWIASTLLIAVCFFWQPIGGSLYEHRGVLGLIHTSIQLVGALAVFMAIRLLDPFELAGIRQTSARTPNAGTITRAGPYGVVRHPIYLGWILFTAGAAHMTIDRALFATISGIYVIVGLLLEERSLTITNPEYASYRTRVRWRLFPYVW